MAASDISQSYNGEVFKFSYDYMDIAQTFVFNSSNWGRYLVDNAEVMTTIKPSVGTDLETSVAGSITFSVTLFHLDDFASAYVYWEGTDVDLEYTLDGTTWVPLVENDAIDLGTDPDFDVRANFDGGVVNDPAELVSLTVLITTADVISSLNGTRKITISSDRVVDSTLSVNTPVTVSAANDTSLVGTVEMLVTPTTSTVMSSIPGTFYKNGAPGSPTAGVKQHLVFVADTPSNTTFTLGPDAVFENVAIYTRAMTATEVSQLYAAQNGAVVNIIDDGEITVTESNPAVDIYAYTWTNV